ncbi:hypothetical protein H257_01858 [Aphanomyces astaci]|uniref:PWWP domain-containing protein n=1 Tax=Aphanomyces astaci TaxID=112090 RepID=W4H6N3_APHAT|nr:hypothetical protein H257_01858 [Aphanomyces astaci]ETV86778.1 hypothetical protein H257_01858 [Aphanomyces astaci]|eukprot:XP_009823577.1 hypothetical protein H257_01858 [Aphanomyces astaci]
MTSYDLGWARRTDELWWPVYVCNVQPLRKGAFHYLQIEHQPAVKLAHKFNGVLVYYLGIYTFSAQTKVDVKRWSCNERHLFSQQEAIADDADMLTQFTTAMAEAKVFEDQGTLPFLTPSDLRSSLTPPPWPKDIMPGTITWMSHASKSWAPAYVFDPGHLRANHNVATRHEKKQLLQASNPNTYYLVYNFGDCQISLWKRGNAKMLPWGCPEHDKFLLGVPRKHPNEYLSKAMKRLEDFLLAKQNQKKLTIKNAYVVQVSWANPSKNELDPNNDDIAISTVDDTMASSGKDMSTLCVRKRKAVEEAPPAMVMYSKKTHLATVMGTSKRPAIGPQPTASLPPPVPPLFRNGVAWAHVRGQLWWPVYICNPHLWSPQPDSPTLTYDVYSFGYHTMRSRAFTLAQLRPWKCPEAPRLRETIFTALDQSKVSDQETLGNALVEADNYYVEYEQIQSSTDLESKLARLKCNTLAASAAWCCS